MGCGSSQESSVALQPASTTRPPVNSSLVHKAETAQQLMQKFPKPKKHSKADKFFTMEEVVRHNSPQSAWSVYRGNVYDITDFLDAHPGGENLLHEKAMGQDCTEQFDLFRHSENGQNMLKLMLIGRLKDPPVYKTVEEIRAQDRSNTFKLLSHQVDNSLIQENVHPANNSARDSKNNSRSSKRDKTADNLPLTNLQEQVVPIDRQQSHSKHSNSKMYEAHDNSKRDSISIQSVNNENSPNTAPLSPTKERKPIVSNPPLTKQLSESAEQRSENTTEPAQVSSIHRGSVPLASQNTKDNNVAIALRSDSYHRSSTISTPPIADAQTFCFELVSISEVTHNTKLLKFKHCRPEDNKESKEYNKLKSAPGKAVMIRMPGQVLSNTLFVSPQNADQSANSRENMNNSLSHSSSVPSFLVPVVRPYTPVTNLKGNLDLLVKRYPSGLFSNYLHNLQVGETISCSPPKGRFEMETFWGNCTCRITAQAATAGTASNLPQEKRSSTPLKSGVIVPVERPVASSRNLSAHHYGHGYYHYWLFICGGTGITPFYSILPVVLKRAQRAAELIPNHQNKSCQIPQVLLLYCNKSAEDVLLRTELLQLAEQYSNFKIIHILKDRNISTNGNNVEPIKLGDKLFSRDEQGQITDNNTNTDTIAPVSTASCNEGEEYQQSVGDDLSVDSNNLSQLFNRSQSLIAQSLNRVNSSVEHSRINTKYLEEKLAIWGINNASNGSQADANHSKRCLSLLCGPDILVNNSLESLEKIGFHRGRGNGKDIFVF
jgi:cytochrome b involved in lipid metabolism/ferredoxin-NADP reductase